MRRARVFETRDSDWKKKNFLLGRVGKNALFQADCLLCFLSVHTSGTRVFETRDLDWNFFFFFFTWTCKQKCFVSSRLLSLFFECSH